ncbi:proline-, glutamic acid/leucine-rich protein [Thalictrum thalictroides]|uniref:Proline-, glutamic acid/leucine-rich protein n=1 Tax=Thalictrum thalictroides TaxID=46969 RepID=A0A7J6W9W4_THATH|nr:proline-, glutamic acid/leucine-rich protein [Thalictrum thalictroides]
MEFLVPPGKKPPPPLGGQELGEASDHAVQRSEQLLFYRVTILMQCCSMMFTNPYSVQQALLPFMTVAQQENICSELPSLHLYSLELLTAVINGIRNQLLPNAAEEMQVAGIKDKGLFVSEDFANIHGSWNLLFVCLNYLVSLKFWLDQSMLPTNKGGWANEERTGSIISCEFNSTWADFQLAALHALLSSLLSPAHCRPQYLGRSLDLFRRGKQETGTKLAEFCAHALLALEVLIHPRALPLANLSLNNFNGFDEGFDPKFPEKPFSSAQEQNTPFSRGVLGIDEPDPNDDLYESWLGNGEEVVFPISNIDENMEQSDNPSNADPSTERKTYDIGLLIVGTLFLDEGRCNEPTGNMNVETGRYADEVMVSIERSQVPVAFSKIGTSNKRVVIPCSQSSSSATESIKSVIDRNALEDSNKGAIPPRTEEAAFSKGTISVIDDWSPPNKLVVASSTPLLDKGNQLMSGNDSDDSIPDIVDADPDSDSG